MLEVRTHYREKCRYCKVYLPKGAINDICLSCSRKYVNYDRLKP